MFLQVQGVIGENDGQVDVFNRDSLAVQREQNGRILQKNLFLNVSRPKIDVVLVFSYDNFLDEFVGFSKVVQVEEGIHAPVSSLRW